MHKTSFVLVFNYSVIVLIKISSSGLLVDCLASQGETVYDNLAYSYMGSYATNPYDHIPNHIWDHIRAKSYVCNHIRAQSYV